jgi:hypothetical protein
MKMRLLFAAATVIVATTCAPATLAHAAPVQTVALSPAQLPVDPGGGIRVKTSSGTLRVVLPANAASGHARDTRQGQAVYDGG